MGTKCWTWVLFLGLFLGFCIGIGFVLVLGFIYMQPIVLVFCIGLLGFCIGIFIPFGNLVGVHNGILIGIPNPNPNLPSISI